MKNKCIAFNNKELLNELSFLGSKFNLKLLNHKEKEEMFDDYENPFSSASYNPFGTPSYWVEINRYKLNNRSRIFLEQSKVFKKLISCDSFKDFSIDGSCNEFECYFFEKGRSNFSMHRHNIVVKYPKIESWDFGETLKETEGNFIKRCKEKFSEDSIYIISFFIACDLKIDFDCEEYEQHHNLKPLQNSLPIRSWKSTELVRDRRYLPLLKNMIIEICEEFENHNIKNYIIEPNTCGDDVLSQMDRQDDLSWGNYDPYGFG